MEDTGELCLLVCLWSFDLTQTNVRNYVCQKNLLYTSSVRKQNDTKHSFGQVNHWFPKGGSTNYNYTRILPHWVFLVTPPPHHYSDDAPPSLCCTASVN